MMSVLPSSLDDPYTCLCLHFTVVSIEAKLGRCIWRPGKKLSLIHGGAPSTCGFQPRGPWMTCRLFVGLCRILPKFVEKASAFAFSATVVRAPLSRCRFPSYASSRSQRRGRGRGRGWPSAGARCSPHSMEPQEQNLRQPTVTTFWETLSKVASDAAWCMSSRLDWGHCRW